MPDRVFCAMCGKAVDPRGADTAAEAKGWAINRTEGGTHALSLRKLTGRFAHGLCVRMATKGISQEQGAMFS